MRKVRVAMDGLAAQLPRNTNMDNAIAHIFCEQLNYYPPAWRYPRAGREGTQLEMMININYECYNEPNN